MIKTAVAAEPENRAYLDSLGWIDYRLGRYAEAVVQLEKAIDEKQPDGTILDHLGDAYENLGRHGDAAPMAAKFAGSQSSLATSRAMRSRPITKRVRRPQRPRPLRPCPHSGR